jgi:hypothetical protein
MRAAEFITEVTIDNVKGAGATPYNQEIDYFGLRVKMKPSVFLKLALPLGQEHSAELEKYIADGGAIGSPFLEIKIPPEWDDSDFSKFAQVAGHEGRNRITAIKKLEGDEPIEVHLIPRGGLRARDLTAEFVEKLQEGMYAERSTHLVSGPLFVSASISSINESKTTINKLYAGNFPDRDESFWDEVRSDEFGTPLEVKVMPKHMLSIILQSQYRVEHLDEILDMMDEDQQEILQRYMSDPTLSSKVILTSGDRIIDGNHRALAAAMRGVPIHYVDLADLDEQDDLDEMALSTYKTFGDFTKPGPFQGADKKLVPHPKNIEKATKFFEKTPYDFRLFFSNMPGTGKYSEYGPMTPEEIKKVFGPQADSILQDSGDAITVVFVGNKGDRKVMLTPWMMAHRFGHAIQAGNRGNRGWSAWGEAEKHFFTTINSTLGEYYGKVDRGAGSYLGKPKTEQMNNNLTPEYNALFNAIGTQRSSRSGEIRRPYEFLYELFAQYLGTGKITFNPLPANLTYGRKAWGNPTNFMNIKPEFRDESERARASEMLAGDMQMMFDDVLSNSVGKVFVM